MEEVVSKEEDEGGGEQGGGGQGEGTKEKGRFNGYANAVSQLRKAKNMPGRSMSLKRRLSKIRNFPSCKRTCMTTVLPIHGTTRQ